MNIVKHGNQTREELIRYYQEAGEDYQTWSPAFNMHFGYRAPGMNPFDLEGMLEQMTLEAVDRLGLSSESQHIVDLGCGLGASLRTLSKKYPHWDLTGVTVVPWQVTQAVKQSSDFQNITILQADYTDTGLPDESVDAVIAIESSCHAQGPGKQDLIKEMHRILKPGGRFVWADGFLKTAKPLPTWLHRVYRTLCRSWALDELSQVPSVYAGLILSGFRKIKFEDISWKVAPSVAHVPLKVLGFMVRQLLRPKKPMNKWRWNNLRSPLLAMILGLARRYFGYYLLYGTKSG